MHSIATRITHPLIINLSEVIIKLKEIVKHIKISLVSNVDVICLSELSH